MAIAATFTAVLFLVCVPVHAELGCLGWGLWNPWVGLFCHFEPEAFGKAEETKVGQIVEEAVQAEENLVEFDLTHNPVAITYDFIETSVTENVTAGLQRAGAKVEDFGHVSVGFAKESVNQGAQAIHILNALDWRDVSLCLIKGVVRHATATRRSLRRRRITSISKEDAEGIADICVSEKLKKISAPAVFNITDPNEKVGATISDIAAMFVPIGPEEKVAAGAAKGAVDLAIPGSEETTRILKKVQDGAPGQSFTDAREAEAVTKKLKDEEWVASNCGTCPISVSAGTNAVNPAQTARMRSRRALSRRGAAMSACCKAPEVIEDIPNAFDVAPQDANPFDDAPSAASEDAESVYMDAASEIFYDPSEEAEITDDELKPPPEYQFWDINVPDVGTNIQTDLDAFSTATISWSEEMKSAISSDELFQRLRDTLKGSTEDPLYIALQPRTRDGGKRVYTISGVWQDSTDPVLKPFQDFSKAAVAHGKKILFETKKGLNVGEADILGNVEFFWTAPQKDALLGVDPRGLHVDIPIIQFGGADVEGLVVKNSDKGLYHRVLVGQNKLQMMKGVYWDYGAFVNGGINGPTWHSVFGEEMANKGRVSFVVNIFHARSP